MFFYIRRVKDNVTEIWLSEQGSTGDALELQDEEGRD